MENRYKLHPFNVLDRLFIVDTQQKSQVEYFMTEYEVMDRLNEYENEIKQLKDFLREEGYDLTDI